MKIFAPKWQKNFIYARHIHVGPAIKSALEDEIRAMQKSNKDLLCTIATKDKRINLLEGQLKSKEQKYQNDIKNIQRRIGELEHELEYKSNTVAYLTSQIQQNKVKIISSSSDNNMMDCSEIRQGGSYRLTPLPPPPSESPTRRRNYNLRRSATSPSASKAGVIQESSSHQLIPSDYILHNSVPKVNATRFSTRYKQSLSDPARPAAGHSQARRDRELKFASPSKPKPSDYEDFIKISQSQEVIKESTIEPLPPITTRSGRQLREPIKTRSRLLRSNKATANSRGEIETVIMDANLQSPERTFRQIQNSSK